MGLKRWWARAAVARAHVLVVAAPGTFRSRVALEQAVRSRGWVLASTPADADVLAVCRSASGASPSIDEAAAGLWRSMSGPRAWVELTTDGDGKKVLADAAAQLLDNDGQFRDARLRSGEDALIQPRDDAGDDDAGDDDADGDNDADGDDMEMAPHGIPLAEGSDDDRDGLEMDVLHVPLGPVLAHWPPELVLHTRLHGDVLAEVEAEVHVASRQAATPTEAAARRCDAVLDVLALAGWVAGALLARQARDALLAGDRRRAEQRIATLRRRLDGHRPLRWMLGGVGVVSADDVPDSVDGTVRALVVGDVRDRTIALIDAAVSSVEAPAGLDPAEVGNLVERATSGLDLAVARLVVASLDVPGLLSVREVAGV